MSAIKLALRTGCCLNVKVGHGRTLDPLASDVLPVALGEAAVMSS